MLAREARVSLSIASICELSPSRGRFLQDMEASQTLLVQPYSQASPVGSNLSLQMMALYQLYMSHDGLIATNLATGTT